jgi:hypothetical protein
MTDTKDERRADALERELRELVESLEDEYLNTGFPGHDPERVDRAHKTARATLAQQEPDRPAQDGGQMGRLPDMSVQRVIKMLHDGSGDRLLGYRLSGNNPQSPGADMDMLDDLEERAARTDQPADAGEPSCCARTREECARVADFYASEHKRCCEETTSDDQKRIHAELEDIAEDISAAIRRTGDTGGGDE